MNHARSSDYAHLRHIAIGLIAAAVLLAPLAARAAVTDEEVRDGIEKLKKKIYAIQKADGTWDPPKPAEDHQFGTHYGGTTALCVYALLTAGESYQAPKLKKAMEFLEKVEMKGSYAVACRAHVWSHTPPQFMDNLQKDVYWLQQSQHPEKGHWNYVVQPSPGYDNSTTQYGLLGLWEGAKRGIPIGNNHWKLVEQHFLSTQHADGAWDYRATGEAGARGSMTAAGLTCLYVTLEYLHSADFQQPGRTPKHPVNVAIEKGLDWFDKNFKPNANPGGGHVHYYLYGCERVGLASGRKFFGKHDWYLEGAEWLLKSNTNDPDALAFSLLFLVRGRVPVFINKLEIPDYHWNNRPRDVEKLTHWVSDTVEQEMNWQVIPIGTNPELWLEAPMLYLAGHEPLNLTDEQAAKIKRYIDLGGMLVTLADRSDPQFTRSVQEMMTKLYPGYEYKQVDPDDELNNVVFKIGGTNRLGAMTLSNGVRHLAIHLPRGDVSWTLHANSMADPTPWQFMVNAYYYATEKGHVRPRLSEHVVQRIRGKGDNAPELTVGRATYEGNWDPEPLAWTVQSHVMYNDAKARVTSKNVPLDNLPDKADTPLVYVVGTDNVEFSDAQIDAVKKYAESGGVIVFENAGGNGEFAKAVMNMLRKAYPAQRLRPISTENAIVTGKGIGGYDMSKVNYRIFALLRMGDVTTPRLLTLNFDDEPRIILSGEDISSGMLGQPIWNVFGYDTDSSRRLAANIALWAAKKAGKSVTAN